MLNGEGDTNYPLYGESRRNLINLIEKWQEAQHSTSRSRYEAKLVTEFWSEKSGPYPNDAPLPSVPALLKMSLPAGSPNLEEVRKNCRVNLHPVGAGVSRDFTYSPGRKWNAWDLAWQQFLILLSSPAWERFGGPCPCCGKYFVRNSKKQTTYCSQRCSSRDTAIKRTLAVLKERRDKKLATAREAAAKWKKLFEQGRTRKSCVEYVVAYDPSAEITTKFLTRAVNQGELRLPQMKPTHKKGTS